MSQSLVFSLSDYDATPSGTRTYITLDIDAESGDFRGCSACILTERDLEAFLSGLDALARGQRRDVNLVGGLGTNEDVRIELFPSNSRGHIGIRVLLAEVPREERPNRLEAHFATEPAPLLRFVEEMRRALTACLETTIGLYVMGGPPV
jgi:hypothetical protein